MGRKEISLKKANEIKRKIEAIENMLNKITQASTVSIAFNDERGNTIDSSGRIEKGFASAYECHLRACLKELQDERKNSILIDW